MYSTPSGSVKGPPQDDATVIRVASAIRRAGREKRAPLSALEAARAAIAAMAPSVAYFRFDDVAKTLVPFEPRAGGR